MEANPAIDVFAKAGFGFARLVGAIEDWISVVFAATVTISGLFGMVFVANEWGTVGPPVRIILAAWMLGWVFLDLWYTARLIHIAVRRRRPFALVAACERRMWPYVLRPIIVFWWFGHFITGAVCAAIMHYSAISGFHHTPRAVGLFTAFGFGFAANGYLMLMVCAATRSEKIRMTVWRFCALIDIGLILIGVVVAGRLANMPTS